MTEPAIVAVGPRVKALREAEGLSLRDLAERVHAGIGAAGALDAQIFAAEGGNRLLDDLLHGERHAPRCECGAPVLRGSHFCPNCGRKKDESC